MGLLNTNEALIQDFPTKKKNKKLVHRCPFMHCDESHSHYRGCHSNGIKINLKSFDTSPSLPPSSSPYLTRGPFNSGQVSNEYRKKAIAFL